MLNLGLITEDPTDLSRVLAMNFERAGIRVAAHGSDLREVVVLAGAQKIDVWVSRPALLNDAGWHSLLDSRDSGRCRRPVVVLCENEGAMAALRGGAAAVLMASDSSWTMTAAIYAAVEGKLFLSPALLSRHQEDILDLVNSQQVPFDEPLTEREDDVLGLLAIGMPNSKIGRTLHISTATVGTHVLNILRKLGAMNRTQAAALAYRNGLLGRTDFLTAPSG